LVRTWTTRLVLFARLWTDSPDDAVQEAFLRLYEQRARPDDAVAWLFKATRNAAIDISRSEARRTRREKAATNPKWFQPNARSRWEVETLMDELQELSPELREVVVAKVWGGLTFEQIGTSTATSRATAQRRYNEAIAILRKRLVAD